MLTPQTEPGHISAAAQRIYAAAATGELCDPVQPLLEAGDVDGAYAVQEINTALWISEGRRLCGRKIGLTSKAVQRAACIDQPDYGMLFSDMEFLDGDSLPSERLSLPKAEGEIAFVLKGDLDREHCRLSDVIAAVDYALPALEIVDTRIRDFKIGLLDTIADNASSGLYVLGSRPVRLEAFDMKMCGMVIERNGEPVSFGAGVACLGSPLHGVLWLARRMVQVGRPLMRGDIVLSGALGPMVDLAAGDFFEVRISGLGSVASRIV